MGEGRPLLLALAGHKERHFFIDNLLVRMHFIIVIVRWTGLAHWEFTYSLQVALHLPSYNNAHNLLAEACWRQVEGLVTFCLSLASFSGRAAGHLPRCVSVLSLASVSRLCPLHPLSLSRLCLPPLPSRLCLSLLLFLSFPPLSRSLSLSLSNTAAMWERMELTSILLISAFFKV